MSLGDTRPFLFQSGYSLLNHHRWDSWVTRSKISYGLIEAQPIPCTPAWDNQVHALAVHPSPNFQHLSSDPHLQSGRWSVVELFCINKQRVKPVVDVRRSSKFDSVWGGLHHWGYTRESWTPSASWFSWFIPNTKTIRWNLGLTLRPHFL